MFIETKSVRGSSTSPLINEPYTPKSMGMNTSLLYSSRPISVKELMKAVKGTPECMGILRTLANDIITSPSFVSKSLNKKTRHVIESKAAAFARNSFFKQELMAAVIDWLGTGDGYLWIGLPKDEDVQKASRGRIGSVVKLKQLLDEDVVPVNALKYVPATTMNIDYNEEEVLGFQQQVNSKYRYWKDDQIIHAIFMKLDGKVYGYSPVEACYSIMKTLGMIKDYAGTFFDNGGVPDNIFRFAVEMRDSPHLKKFEQNLEEFTQNKRRGSFVATGLDGVEKINEFNKDMEFRKLAIYYTGILAFTFGMPLGKIQAILGADVKSSASGADTEDSGYWRNIEEAQDYWETILDTQFWNPYFSVDIMFKRKYHQDLIRKTQARIQAWSLASEMMNREFPVSDDFFFDILDIPRKYITQDPIKRGMLETPQMAQMADKKVMPGENAQKKAENKKLDAKKVEEGKGGNLGV